MKQHKGVVAELDRLVHGPARFVLLCELARSEDGADFALLKRKTGLSDSNLSSNVRRLEKAGFVHLKWMSGRRPRRNVRLTPTGLEALEAHYRCLDLLRPPGGDASSATGSTDGGGSGDPGDGGKDG